MATFNRQQWIDTFQGQLAILRRHLTPRLLDIMSLSAWYRYGLNGEDPIQAAKAWSANLDEP
jgi:hypothetical protein